MAATKATTANWAKAVLEAISASTFASFAEQEHLTEDKMEQLMLAIRNAIQAHQHTGTSSDTDSQNTGDARLLALGDATDGSTVGELNAKYQVVADTGNADTEFTVAHGLGRTPVGFLVVNANKAGYVYDSGSAWGSTNILLKASAANMAITLMIF